MYKALVRFADLQDGGHIYEAGSEFPRLGFVVSQIQDAGVLLSAEPLYLQGFPLFLSLSKNLKNLSKMSIKSCMLSTNVI